MKDFPKSFLIEYAHKMHHLAIMNPHWHLIEKILSGDKTIESRWYKNKIAPWGRISAGDTVYFKNAGKPITAKAVVAKVIKQEIHSVAEGLALAEKFRNQLCFSASAFTNTDWLIGKRYVIFIFLENPQRLAPFSINKTGYGNACAWITLSDIKTISTFSESSRQVAGTP